MDKISINKFIILFILILFKPEILLSQNVISADPNKIIEIEYNLYRDSSSFSMSAIRPIINNNFSNKWRLFFQSEFYFNSNAPNF